VLAMSLGCILTFGFFHRIRPEGWVFWLVTNLFTYMIFSLAGYAIGRYRFEDVEVEEI
jgi:hypothetical protein